MIDAKSLPDLPGMMLATIEALKAIGCSASIDELDGTTAICGARAPRRAAPMTSKLAELGQ